MIKKILFPTLLVLTVSAVAAPLKIGWATTDISTDKPIFMQGTTRERQMQGLRDPLMTTALVIDNGEDCVIFSTWDVCVVWGTVAQRVRSIVGDRCPEIPTDKIIIHAIHTHQPAECTFHCNSGILIDKSLYLFGNLTCQIPRTSYFFKIQS